MENDDAKAAAAAAAAVVNSPAKIKRKFVGGRQNSILINIYKELMKNEPKMMYNDMMKRISNMSGIGIKTVAKTISEYKRSGIVTSPNKERATLTLFNKLDYFHKRGIRQKVHSFWLRREVPTLDKICQAINDDEALPNISKLNVHSVLKSMDFVYTKRKRNCILTERQDLINWRRNYLYEVRKYREQNRPVYYLDETWVNAGDCNNMLWQDKSVKSSHDAFIEGLTTGAVNPTSKGKRLIILHIGSEKGFVEKGLLCFESKKNFNDYHDEINVDTFKEWFANILPLLERNSVIVMDNAPYHSVRQEKIPTSNWKKNDILMWLLSKGEQIDGPMVKSQLLTRVKQIKEKYMGYVIDKMANDTGHTVLRLPPYHCEFNPIELAWAVIKGYIKKNNSTFHLGGVQQLLLRAVACVTPEDWANFIKHVIKEENKMWDIDDIMDELIDNLEPCI